MRFINARQSWHDAYMPNIKTSTANTLETLQLGVHTQQTKKTNNNYSIIHTWLAGKIQHEISLLPPVLQHLGHFFYSPIATSKNKDIAHQLIWIIINDQLDAQEWSENELANVYWLIDASLKSYKSLVINGKDILNTPRKIIKYMLQEHQISFDLKTWKTKWQPIYHQILFVCNELDKQALAPLIKLIKTNKEQ